MVSYHIYIVPGATVVPGTWYIPVWNIILCEGGVHTYADFNFIFLSEVYGTICFSSSCVPYLLHFVIKRYSSAPELWELVL